MACHNTRLRRDIGKYLQRLRTSNFTEEYIKVTRGILLAFQRHCAGLGVTATSKVRADTFRSFCELYDAKASSYRQSVYHTVRGFLQRSGNTEALEYKLRLHGCLREHVDWLTPQETEQIIATPMTPREAVLLRGGLLQGLRRIELWRMTRRDAQSAIATNILHVKGKGGRMREVPLHLGFKDALLAYVSRSQGSETDRLIVVGLGQMYKCVVWFSIRFGRRFSTHTLRRTFGRNLWLHEIPIETISELMGHASTDMTRRYLGINIADMRKAITEYNTKSELKIIEQLPRGCR